MGISCFNIFHLPYNFHYICGKEINLTDESIFVDSTTEAYLSATTVTNISQSFLNVLPTIGRQKPTGIDMEQNYVTVTNCIAISHALLTSDIAHGQPANCYNSFKYKNIEV